MLFKGLLGYIYVYTYKHVCVEGELTTGILFKGTKLYVRSVDHGSESTQRRCDLSQVGVRCSSSVSRNIFGS